MTRLELPVIFANLSGSRQVDTSRIPQRLADRYTMSVAFGPSIIKFALDDFPDEYNSNRTAAISLKKRGPYHYTDVVYTRLGL